MIVYHYMICDQPDEEIFEKQCAALLKNVPNLKLKDELDDVDSSIYRTYEVNGAIVEVSNDYYIGGVFVKSEIELTQFFPEK